MMITESKFEILGVEEEKMKLEEELEKLKKELKIWKAVAVMACDDEYWSCPDQPERINLQDIYGSDEPYWVQEGGCESQDHCNECRLNFYYNKAKKKVEEKK